MINAGASHLDPACPEVASYHGGGTGCPMDLGEGVAF